MFGWDGGMMAVAVVCLVKASNARFVLESIYSLISSAWIGVGVGVEAVLT